jgi:flagellar hook-length control protein FliK
VLPASSRGVLLTILATSPKAAAPAVRPTNATTPVVACGRVAGTLAKSSARPAVAAEPEPRSSDANVERILRFVRAQIGKDRAVATLRLDPPELGTIRLRMDLRNEQLALDVQTQTVAARRLLSKHVETLRRDLEASGIHLGRVEIHAAPRIDARETATPQSGDWSAPDGSQSQSDPQTAGGGQSGELESPRAGPSELEGEPAFPGSVTESLVNILA